MEQIVEGSVIQAGTYCTNPLVMSAANAVLDELAEPGTYDHLFAVGERLGSGLEEIISREETFVEYAREHRVLLPGTSGIQGDAPKMMLVVARDGLYYADGTVPDEDVKEYVIIKLRRGKTERDLQVLRNEAPKLALVNMA